MSVYLVFAPFGIIATDLAASIHEFDRDADVVVVASLGDAAPALAKRKAVRVAFMHADPNAFFTSPLADLFAHPATVCVFMGNEAKRQAGLGFTMLGHPLSISAVSSLLAGVVTKD